MVPVSTQLREHLLLTLSLAEEVLAAPQRVNTSALGELRQRGVAYVTAFRSLVMPALRAGNWQGVQSNLLVAFVNFQGCLAELLTARTNPDAWRDVEAFGSSAKALFSAQETVLVPALVEGQLDRNLSLSSQMELALQLRGPAAGPFDLSLALERVREASVVLETLAAMQRKERASRRRVGTQDDYRGVERRRSDRRRAEGSIDPRPSS